MAAVKVNNVAALSAQRTRPIQYIVVHCTAGNAKATPTDVLAVFRQRGWRRPGYHLLVTQDGTVWQLSSLSQVVNGAVGYNYNSIHVAYTGGVNPRDIKTPADTRTAAQRTVLAQVLRRLHEAYPEARVCGHRDLPRVQKACPSFDVEAEYGYIWNTSRDGGGDPSVPPTATASPWG